jgi:hypothetical protein
MKIVYRPMTSVANYTVNRLGVTSHPDRDTSLALVSVDSCALFDEASHPATVTWWPRMRKKQRRRDASR